MTLSLSIPPDRYWQALCDTLAMVGVSSALTLLFGIPLALLLIVTAPGGFVAAPRLNRAFGAMINGFRATPFIVLMVALIPLTRMVAGTTIGVWAAIVPLSIAATPFFARIAEVSLRQVPCGVVEAAQAMGAQRWHIVWHVLLSEALPGIIGGFTITVVSIIGSSAMAGAVGAGGLGDLAIRYGYQRFDTQVMFLVIAILIGLVSLVQWLGDQSVRYLQSR